LVITSFLPEEECKANRVPGKEWTKHKPMGEREDEEERRTERAVGKAPSWLERVLWICGVLPIGSFSVPPGQLE
jgi:hypothetical protein